MSWFAALLALLVSHAVGDVLFQTDWQALNKIRGMRDRMSRRALAHHLATYTLAFVPALVWIGSNTSAGRAVAIGALVAVPHALIDDGRFVRLWLERVKGVQRPGPALTIAVDQSFHVVCLLGAALVAGG
jgi:Protein of unknown function (DUF3307)